MHKLFTPFRLGPIELSNRMVMAPMSRNRADAAEAAHALTAKYYEQRATAGLIVTEASPVSPEARVNQKAPGIYSETQVSGWRLVTRAVHAAGGKIFVQLWHAGKGELAQQEIPAVIAQFGAATRRARAAEFDGVEVHAANGYLIDRFIRDGTNHRSDAYGGPIENRARILLEILDAIASVWSSHRVGIRLSPVNAYNDMKDSNPQRTFNFLAGALNGRGVSYLHVDETSSAPFDWDAFRRCYEGVYIANGGYDRQRTFAAVESRHADLVSFGVLFLANPDLVERFRIDAPLNPPDRATFYGGDERGYTNYPRLPRV